MTDQLATTGALNPDQIRAVRRILGSTPIVALADRRPSAGIENFDDVLANIASMRDYIIRILAENENLKNELATQERDMQAAGRVLRRMGLAVDEQ